MGARDRARAGGDRPRGARHPGAPQADSAELRRVKDARILALTDDLGSWLGLAQSLCDRIRPGLDTAYWNSRAAALEAVTRAQLDAATAKLTKPDQLIWIVVGDLAKIRGDVRKLGRRGATPVAAIKPQIE